MSLQNNGHTVYVHVFPNGKRYVGMTRHTLKKRWGTDGKGYKTQRLFWRAIQKHGWCNIAHSIIAENLSHENAK